MEDVRRPINREAAIRRCTNRWAEQQEKFPQSDVSLKLYLARNADLVMRRDLFRDYDQR